MSPDQHFKICKKYTIVSKTMYKFQEYAKLYKIYLGLQKWENIFITRPRQSGPISWILNFGDIKVLVTIQFWWYFSLGDISVLVIFQFRWIFSFGDILVLLTFQIWWQFSLGDFSVLVTFLFWCHFSFSDTSVLVTYQF